MPDSHPEPDSRSRLMAAMSAALQRRGFHGVGLTELLAQAGAPKGVLYHHFPGGKTELAVAAIAATGERIASQLSTLAASGAEPVPLLRSWLAGARRQLEGSQFEQGCPLATVALESTAEDANIRAALALAFERIRQQLAQLLGAAGVPPTRAASLATLIVAAYEGALLQARVAGQGQALTDTAEALVGVVEAELNRNRNSQ